jgi:excisionase family DNA binding protein
MALPRYITLDEAAEALSISRRSMRRLISSGQLPAFRVGNGNARSLRINSDDLAKVLHSITPSGAA